MKKKIKPFVISGAVLLMIGFAVYCVYAIRIEHHDMGQIPDLTGFEYQAAKEYYANMFDLVVEDLLYSNEYPDGAIISQSPAAGKDYIVGRSTVQCVVSKGVRMVTIPNVCGIDLETVQMILSYEMLDVVIEYEYSDEISEGYVISTSPEKFEKAPAGSAITVVVSKGSPENTEDNSMQN